MNSEVPLIKGDLGGSAEFKYLIQTSVKHPLSKQRGFPVSPKVPGIFLTIGVPILLGFAIMGAGQTILR
jgi:hypothetical protein